MKCRPSGRNDGIACCVSPRDRSGIVRGEAADPPAAETRIRPPVAWPKMITPSRFHEPPTIFVLISHIVSAGPPEMGIFLSFPPASKAMYRLSGDQKKGGTRFDSEPGRGRGSSESRARTQTR